MLRVHQSCYFPHYEVVHDGYEERDIKGKTKEARFDFIDNTTDRELDRTPNLSHVLELRKVWKDKGGLVEVAPLPPPSQG